MINLEEAEFAKAVLRARLARPKWLRGIGLTKDANNSYSIKVNISSLEECPLSPDMKVGRVPVMIDVVGDIVATRPLPGKP